jgi:hypothetical protein
MDFCQILCFVKFLQRQQNEYRNCPTALAASRGGGGAFAVRFVASTTFRTGLSAHV